MSTLISAGEEPGAHVSSRRTAALLRDQHQRLCRRTDRLFAVLMVLQWLAGLAAACWISPRTWAATSSQVHPHVWAALFLGGAVAAPPVCLAVWWPGRVLTRHVIAGAQLLMSGLLIHLTGGRLETHFHVFGSLAFLAFYRDWRVLITASAVTAADHFLRGLFWPQSIYGVAEVQPWRFLEHAGWVVFEDIFLTVSCLQSAREMRGIAAHRAGLEATEAALQQAHRKLELRVQARTADLARANAALQDDIGRRQRAEAALRESEARFRAVYEAAAVGITQTDADGTLLHCNPAFERMLGYEPGTLQGRRFAELTHPDDTDTNMELHREVLRGRREFYQMQKRYLHKDGRVVWANLTVSLVRDAEGAPRFGLGIVEDITARHQAQEDLTRLSRQNQMLLESAGEGFYGLDLEGRATFVNPAAAQMLGWAAEALVGQPMHAVSHHSHGDGASYPRKTCPIYLALRDGAVHRTAEEVFWRKDGTCFPVEYTSTPMCDGERIVGAVVTFRDISERRAAEAQIQSLNEALLRAYDATIESWARVLDLRDRETEGHSRRVTEMTLRLAQAFGLPDEDLIHIRRGALLHDIGKMGVPDAILHKPGPLTGDEWALMRRHPGYAHEMLSSIEFLHPALDIPHGHHEKWDGTGYPLGLCGEEIPLAARLFAIVDVWDALRSDRPYRAGWPEDKVRDHIASLAGSHFDPHIVGVFLDQVAPSPVRHPQQTLLAA